MKYNICIGEMWNMEQRMTQPAKMMSISEEQRDILILFAEKRIDKNCNPVYQIGPCEFTIQPDFELKMGSQVYQPDKL